MLKRKEMVRYYKNGNARVVCQMSDEVFLDFVGHVMLICIKFWNISFQELGKIFEKYDLVKYIYNGLPWFIHCGDESIVECLEEYLKEVSLNVKQTL